LSCWNGPMVFTEPPSQAHGQRSFLAGTQTSSFSAHAIQCQEQEINAKKQIPSESESKTSSDVVAKPLQAPLDSRSKNFASSRSVQCASHIFQFQRKACGIMCQH
jgi:hypothetical protein